ncbi:probable methyltransferase PMT23 [Olea europaea subsp. europaea]|uniref:Methyltransferase n=1 Tax=Olea europaea subsp. europaea TaxID=158383 RepID=A0A8S0T3L1_OLEEU|nr:probable methyltransferase PMT23 [Olea europaea subsp. europaea]
MAISSSIPNLLKQRKYPFIFAFFLLLICVTLLLISNSQSPISTTADLSQPDPYSSKPVPQPSTHSPENTAPSNNTNATADTRKDTTDSGTESGGSGDDGDEMVAVEWKVCDGSVAVDYIPCLDNRKAIMALRSRRHMEHRERHCPDPCPRCLVPLPQGYKIPVPWPKSRDMVWYDNVPHPKLVEYKKDQRWVVKSGDYFIFPGGGTQFKDGVAHYIDSIEKSLPIIEWGKKTRVILDVGCGVASFGGALLDRDVITTSFAPKDEHEAQIQFALERGIPATLSVIGTQKLTFPDNAYDLIHCARCRVHWDADGGKPLMELNRVLRPGGFFIWSATPVYRKDERDKNVWKSMVALTEALCWKVVVKTFFDSSQVGLVVYQKPVSSSCYENRKENNPPLCDLSNQPNNSWYAPLDSCLPPLPSYAQEWPSSWPDRLTSKPPSISSEPDAVETFNADSRHWSALVSEVYLGGLNINWSSVRNVMDMNAGYGGFAAALINLPLWVMNIVPIHETDTLSVIFDRGLIGVYHDWCESLNTYPRTYDLLHSSFLFRNLTQRCDMIDVAVEMDRVLRPGGYLLVQESMEIINKLVSILKSLHWSVNVHQEQFLVGKKEFWRPEGKTRI